MNEMYAEIILDYYRNPRNFGKVKSPDSEARDSNTACGDAISFSIKVKDGKIADIKFEGKGCAISVASTSMLTEFVIGKTVKEAAEMKKEEILQMLEIPISPMRLKCALLGFKVFKLAIYSYMGQKYEEENH